MGTDTSWTYAAVQPSEMEALQSLVGGMTKHAGGFSVQGDSVEILETPSQFYNVLLQGVRNARSRVVIASLYIGTGTLEQELVFFTLRKHRTALKVSNGSWMSFQIRSRGNPTCRDFGFDPLGLGEVPENLERFKESEILHCRLCMVAIPGALIPELGYGNWINAHKWAATFSGLPLLVGCHSCILVQT